MPGLLRARVATAAIALSVMVAGCSNWPTRGNTGASPSKGKTTVCASTGPPVSLGRRGRESEPALFTSDGSQLVFTASGFSHGGLEFSKVGSTRVSVGNPNRRPVHNRATGVTTNVSHEFSITEGQVTAQTLPAGRYWLVNSNGVEMTVRSCPAWGVALLLPSGQRSSSTVNGNPLARAPMNVSVGDLLRLEVKPFRPGSPVHLRLDSQRKDLGSVTADSNGRAQTTVTVPDLSPGVHQLELRGVGVRGAQVTRQVRLRLAGRPSGGYTTYLCCFRPRPATVTADTMAVSVGPVGRRVDVGNFPVDPDGGALVRIPNLDRLMSDGYLFIQGKSSVTGEVVEESLMPIPTVPSLWAASRAANAISVTGARFAADGVVHSEGGIRVSGAGYDLSGGVEAAAKLQIADGPNTPVPLNYKAGGGSPAVPKMGRYRPGGTASRSGVPYTAVSMSDCVKGQWTPRAGMVLTGVVYVPCGLTLTATGTYGATFAAEGPITVSSNKTTVGQSLPAGEGQPSLVTAATGAAGILITGADITLLGQALAPTGQVHVSGARVALGCGVVASTITVSGADSSARINSSCLSS
jgi:hypothetical protein